jgi:hypothetical protein
VYSSIQTHQPSKLSETAKKNQLKILQIWFQEEILELRLLAQKNAEEFFHVRAIKFQCTKEAVRNHFPCICKGLQKAWIVEVVI